MCRDWGSTSRVFVILLEYLVRQNILKWTSHSVIIGLNNREGLFCIFYKHYGCFLVSADNQTGDAYWTAVAEGKVYDLNISH